ncbi:MAG: DUF971 domain-containing protein [Gammaproteobacteria bacterium]|nr:DUF971 domain-containing protein [Gammaproteobacteria bacterium]
MSKKHDPIPTELNYDGNTRMLKVSFDDGKSFDMSAEYLRVFSPSAEVQGHSPASAKLQYGKENVKIDKIEATGNYAVTIFFDDGHDSGIFSWSWLYGLGINQDANWQDYLERLKAAGKERKATQVVQLQ